MMRSPLPHGTLAVAQMGEICILFRVDKVAYQDGFFYYTVGVNGRSFREENIRVITENLTNG